MHPADASVVDHLEKLTKRQNLTMGIDNLYAFMNPLVLSFPIYADANAAASRVTVFQPFEKKNPPSQYPKRLLMQFDQLTSP